jgi:hypothetical protein
MPAPAGPAVEVLGTDEVLAAFDSLEKRTASQLVPSTELGRLGQLAALQLVPRLTGELAGAIEAAADEHSAALVVDSDHAAYMEFGTRYVLEHRYMKAGFDAMAEAAPDVYGRWLEDQVAQTGG